MRLPILAFLMLTVIAQGKEKPAFSCTGKLTPTERRICDNDDLAREDKYLSRFYEKLQNLVSSSDRNEITAAQRKWIADRDTCPDAACILKKVKEREAVLQQRSTEAVKAAEKFMSDRGLIEKMKAEGWAVLRKTYSDEINSSIAGPLTINSFDCQLTSFQKIHCTTSLGSATCEEGVRDVGLAEFDARVAEKQISIENPSAHFPCGEEVSRRPQ